MEHLPSDMLSAVAEFIVLVQTMIAQRLSRNAMNRPTDAERSHEQLHDGRSALVDTPLDAWPRAGAKDTEWPQPHLDRRSI